MKPCRTLLKKYITYRYELIVYQEDNCLMKGLMMFEKTQNKMSHFTFNKQCRIIDICSSLFTEKIYDLCPFVIKYLNESRDRTSSNTYKKNHLPKCYFRHKIRFFSWINFSFLLFTVIHDGGYDTSTLRQFPFTCNHISLKQKNFVCNSL